jgi:DNA-binding CsgD family transcriptional regulator
MAGHLPQLDRAALVRLREAARVLWRPAHRALPVRQILDVWAAAPAGPGFTIDVEASRDLGEALIVVRLPAPDHAPDGDPRLGVLSRREREVAGLVAAGLSNKMIASRLGIAASTVKDHVHHILEKTGLPNRAAVAAACRAARRDP